MRKKDYEKELSIAEGYFEEATRLADAANSWFDEGEYTTALMLWSAGLDSLASAIATYHSVARYVDISREFPEYAYLDDALYEVWSRLRGMRPKFYEILKMVG